MLQIATVGGASPTPELASKLTHNPTLMQGGVAMRKALSVIFNLLLLGLPALALAAGGEKVPDMSTRQVPVQGLSAVNHFFAQWYNNNKYIYAIIVTVIMCLLGMLIALVTDILLKAVGMEVSKIEHHE
jgi:ABC-type phosphate/phosphonate transport system permease subunit